MENLTPQQALDIIYQAARMVALPAKEHELINQAATVLNNILNPKEPCNESK